MSKKPREEIREKAESPVPCEGRAVRILRRGMDTVASEDENI